MNKNLLVQEVQNYLPSAEVMVESDDDIHFDMIVVSGDFEGLMPVKRQRLVYDAIDKWILDGTLHALGLKTYTPKEWQKKNQK